MDNHNQWQKDEFEITHPICPIIQKPKERAEFLCFITVVGPEIELDNVIEYLKEPFQSNQFELPAFTEKEELGKSVLVINLNTYEVYKTEAGIQVGEWRRFYLPFQYPDLVKELLEEAKRLKQKEPKEFD